MLQEQCKLQLYIQIYYCNLSKVCQWAMNLCKWAPQEGIFKSCDISAYTMAANGACLHLLVPPLTQYWCFLLNRLTSVNRRAYFREKSTLCNNFIKKMWVGLFSRLGLFSRDYGSDIYIKSGGGKDAKEMKCAVTQTFFLPCSTCKCPPFNP